MQFEEMQLNPSLMRAMEEMGFHTPTPIQKQAIPAALEGRDLLGTAQTGTGKTVAYLLPGLQRLLERTPNKNPGMVVLAPTRELVMQIGKEARSVARFTSLRIAAVYGGAPMNKQIEQLRRGVDFVVATPGRLMDHMRRGNIHYRDLEILVLDEADRMLDMGFLPDIEMILSRMPRQRQTMLFSATMPQVILSLSHRFLKDPFQVAINPAQPPSTIRQQLYPVAKHLKIPLLIELLQKETVESALIFTRTKQEADVLTRKLKEAKFSVTEIHGDFRQQQRNRALERFRAGKARILVATNVAARGLDIEGISHVVNFDVPDEAENYVHRIGRTARYHAEGVAWTLVTPDDEPLIQAIEYLLKKSIERVVLPDFNYDVPVPDWAKSSADTILRNLRKNQSSIDRWKALTR